MRYYLAACLAAITMFAAAAPVVLADEQPTPQTVIIASLDRSSWG